MCHTPKALAKYVTCAPIIEWGKQEQEKQQVSVTGGGSTPSSYLLAPLLLGLRCYS